MLAAVLMRSTRMRSLNPHTSRCDWESVREQRQRQPTIRLKIPGTSHAADATTLQPVVAHGVSIFGRGARVPRVHGSTDDGATTRRCDADVDDYDDDDDDCATGACACLRAVKYTKRRPR